MQKHISIRKYLRGRASLLTIEDDIEREKGVIRWRRTAVQILR